MPRVCAGATATIEKEPDDVHARRMNVGVLGTGEVSTQYLPNLVASETLNLIGLADLNVDAAEALARRCGVERVYVGEEILAAEDIDMIINLTPIPAHYETNRRILEAGKHVYTEKPLATTTADSAELVRLADSLGLRIACAPDTIFGDGFQTGRAVIERGDIGKPLSASATMLRPVPPLEINRIGAIPFLNMAPYYLTAFVNLFGPVREISGTTQLYDCEGRGEQAPFYTNCGLLFDDDVLCTLTLRYGDTPVQEVPLLSVLGTEGELWLPNPDTFAAAVMWRPNGQLEWNDVAVRSDETVRGPNQRGRGAEDLAHAVWEGRLPRAGGDVAVNVVETVHALTSPDPCTGRVGARLTTNCRQPTRVELRG